MLHVELQQMDLVIHAARHRHWHRLWPPERLVGIAFDGEIRPVVDSHLTWLEATARIRAGRIFVEVAVGEVRRRKTGLANLAEIWRM
ncbi:hypothetical protein D3C72_2435720 [compost metagenome]